jgi:hypothetical protein
MVNGPISHAEKAKGSFVSISTMEPDAFRGLQDIYDVRLAGGLRVVNSARGIWNRWLRDSISDNILAAGSQFQPPCHPRLSKTIYSSAWIAMALAFRGAVVIVAIIEM